MEFKPKGLKVLLIYIDLVTLNLTVCIIHTTALKVDHCVNNSPIRAHVGGQRKCEERKKRDVYQRNYSILLEPVGQGGEGERWISGQQEGNVLFYISMGLANFMT